MINLSNVFRKKTYVKMGIFLQSAKSDSSSNPRRKRHAGLRKIMETYTCIEDETAFSVMLREARVCECGAPMCVRIQRWLLRRADRSSVLIGAIGTWRSHWRRRDVGVLIGQSVCRLLALALGC